MFLFSQRVVVDQDFGLHVSPSRASLLAASPSGVAVLRCLVSPSFAREFVRTDEWIVSKGSGQEEVVRAEDESGLLRSL